ncbi:helix-turn-helix transcriptional regulator [Kocuria sp. M1N1S27]|uniref:helix-turn-helix transcriptional regulator n=1 Tax=Kocuria kalidii TaxID=3376283 RepID=UPI0037940D1A
MDVAAGALLTREDLAARYSVPKATIDQWAYKKYGPPYFRVGRYARYRIEDVLAWEGRQASVPGEPAR